MHPPLSSTLLPPLFHNCTPTTILITPITLYAEMYINEKKKNTERKPKKDKENSKKQTKQGKEKERI